eukprot:g7944.t1
MRRQSHARSTFPSTAAYRNFQADFSFGVWDLWHAWHFGPLYCTGIGLLDTELHPASSSTLDSHGPVRPPTLSTVDDVNSALSKLLPDVNRQLHKNIKDSAGDCEAWTTQETTRDDDGAGQALWDYRTLKGEVLFSSDAPLAHMSSDRGAVGTDITVLWATGLRSMEIADMVTPPADMSAPVQPWFITLSAMFTDLHVYMKVIVNGKEWLKDYMCCDKTLHFTLKVSAECHVGFGFSALHLELLNMDKVNFVQKTQMILDSGASASFEMDYGTSATVEKAIANFLTLKTGNLLMRNSDGSTTDTLQTAGEALSHVIQLNTGKRCLQHDACQPSLWTFRQVESAEKEIAMNQVRMPPPPSDNPSEPFIPKLNDLVEVQVTHPKPCILSGAVRMARGPYFLVSFLGRGRQDDAWRSWKTALKFEDLFCLISIA